MDFLEELKFHSENKNLSDEDRAAALRLYKSLQEKQESSSAAS